jgi:universal stress protein A
MFQVRKIVVATDFSPCASAAFDRAADLAKALRAEILLLHVLPDVAQYGPFPHSVPTPITWLDLVRMEARDHLAKESHRIKDLAVKTELREGGKMHDAIIAAAAAANADMIVIGTHGWSGIKHAVMGSVAERIVRHSPIPVLTVRSPD